MKFNKDELELLNESVEILIDSATNPIFGADLTIDELIELKGLKERIEKEIE